MKFSHWATYLLLYSFPEPYYYPEDETLYQLAQWDENAQSWKQGKLKEVKFDLCKLSTWQHWANLPSLFPFLSKQECFICNDKVLTTCHFSCEPDN